MSSTVRAAKCDARRTRRAAHILFSAWIVATVTAAAIVIADPPQGSIVGWGSQVVGVDLSSGFVAVAAGFGHSLALKADGAIVAWGDNGYGLANVPAPNTGFVAVAAGYYYSLGLKDDGSIVAWGNNDSGQTKYPRTNNFINYFLGRIV